jgi:pentalenene oxygenase
MPVSTLRTIAKAPGGLPLVGHAVPLVRNPLAFLTGLPECGELVRVRLGPVTAIVVTDPELTHQVLLDDRTFDKGGPFFDQVRGVLGDSLATCAHSRHRRQRRLLQPAFRTDRLPCYAQAMTRQVTASISEWRDGQILDVPAEMLKMFLPGPLRRLPLPGNIRFDHACRRVRETITGILAAMKGAERACDPRSTQ